MRARHAAVVLLALVIPVFAFGKRGAEPPSPLQRLIAAEVTVIGTVEAIEKETVEGTSGGQKVSYTVASVKVDTPLVGGKNVTHVKVGFVATGQPSRYGNPQLAEGQKACLFLTKQPDAGFYVMNWMAPPVDVTDANKGEIERLTVAAAALADPVKALRADKAEDRLQAAVALVIRYRTRTAHGGGEADREVDVPAEESALVLKALAEGDWTQASERETPLLAFYAIGVGEKDGLVVPQPKPGEDSAVLTQKAFAKWVDGPGAKYQIKRYAPKK